MTACSSQIYKRKIFQFLLESMIATGCPDVCRKAAPSSETSNTEFQLALKTFLFSKSYDISGH